MEFTEKVTVYFAKEQVEKLDDLVYQYRKQTGRRINRNMIIRHLVNQITLDQLVADLPSEAESA